MSHNIVLIHLGDVFYNHINESINQIKKFTNSQIILLTSSNHFSLIKSNVELVAIESIQLSEKHKEYKYINRLDTNFRGGFWRHASERFFYLEEVAEKYNLKNIFHFENDVLIYNDLDKIQEILLQNKITIAATFDNDNRCIPGYVFFENSLEVSNLTQFMLTEKFKLNDMEMLSKYSHVNHFFKYLPVIPDFYSQELKSIDGNTSINNKKYFELFKIFNSIFDAAALGQYLGGIDPRNGISKPHFINEAALYQVDNFSFVWHLDEQGRNCPFVLYKDIEIKINNLHIHSKQLKQFV